MNPNLQTARPALTTHFGATYAQRRGFAQTIRHAGRRRLVDPFEPAPEEVIDNDALREVLEARLARDTPDHEGFHVRMS